MKAISKIDLTISNLSTENTKTKKQKNKKTHRTTKNW